MYSIEITWQKTHESLLKKNIHEEKVDNNNIANIQVNAMNWGYTGDDYIRKIGDDNSRGGGNEH